MKKRIIDYRERIDRLLDEAPQETDWKGVAAEHLTQIVFFQHERLVHLIVTITFAILTLLSFGIMLLSDFLPVLGLIVLFLILLVPYIGHYYTLENEVQKMYVQYDRLLLQYRGGHS